MSRRSEAPGKETSLASALAPRSIAVIGASTNPNKIGGRPIAYCRRFGYGGRIYPVNPGSDIVQGLPAFARLADVPEAPDLAVVAVPRSDVLPAIEACAAKGVRSVVVMTSGFAETGTEGAALQQRMLEIAAPSGMRIIGPNTQGIANFSNGAVASFATMFTSTVPADGPVAVISQSGAMSVVPYALLRERGIGVRHTHATGNEADLTIADFVRAILDDEEVRLILLYFESINDPDGLEAAAHLARVRDVPIVALKAGRTTAGQAAATSHTGALAVTDKVIDAFLESCRIYRAGDLRGLVNATELYLAGRRPTGRRTGLISNSGASCVMAADLAEAAGLEVTPLGMATAERLRGVLPGFAHAANPIDLTAALLTDNALFPNVLEALADGGDFDLAMVTIPNAGEGYDIAGFARAFADYARRSGTAIACAMPQSDALARFRAAGVPGFTYDTDAIAALAQLAAHGELMGREAPPPLDERAAPELPEARGGFLDEATSLRLLGNAGIAVPRFRVCRSEAEARSAYAELGPDVVLKGCSAAFPHKSEHGLVLLSVADEADLVRGHAALRARLEALDPEHGGVIVAEKLAARHEFILGAQFDPDFGVMVMLGDGGRYVEALKDYVLLRYPFGDADFDRALARLRIAPVLAGVRGEPPFDTRALGALAAALGRFVAAAGGRIRSVDLNPVMASPDGRRFTAADAVIEIHDAGSDTSDA